MTAESSGDLLSKRSGSKPFEYEFCFGRQGNGLVTFGSYLDDRIEHAFDLSCHRIAAPLGDNLRYFIHLIGPLRENMRPPLRPPLQTHEGWRHACPSSDRVRDIRVKSGGCAGVRPAVPGSAPLPPRLNRCVALLPDTGHGDDRRGWSLYIFHAAPAGVRVRSGS